MPAAVLVKKMVDALEKQQMNHWRSFVHLDTGDVETVFLETLSKAEESSDDEEPGFPDWQRDEWDLAKRIVSSDRFQPLPTRFDVHEWAIMQDFAFSVGSDSIREDLLHALNGAGAFRMFKNTIRRHRIESDWYAFRQRELRRIAIKWCEEHRLK